MPTQLTHNENKPTFLPAAVRNPSPENEGNGLVEEQPLLDAAIQEKPATGPLGNCSSSGGGNGEESSNTTKLFSYLKVQPKLTVDQPGDKYEQEADRVADTVMRMPEVQRQPIEEEEEELQMKSLSDQITPLVQRQPMEEEEEEPIQAKEASGCTPTPNAPDMETSLNAMRGGGQPLPETNRNFMERRFGSDFSGVRVHTDSNAMQMSRGLNAEAFTYGNNIYFGAGRYSPRTSLGKKLLAHELTHVVQQGGAPLKGKAHTI